MDTIQVTEAALIALSLALMACSSSRSAEQGSLQSNAAGIRPVTVDTAPSGPCRGGGSGVFDLSPAVGVVYSIRFEGDGVGPLRAHLQGAIVARGKPGWRSTVTGDTSQSTSPQLPEPTGYLSGGSWPGLSLQFDLEARNAWVDTQKVPLPEGHNVVLVDRADRIEGPIQIVKTLVVDPDFLLPGPSCSVRNEAGADARRAAIREAILRAPEVVAFAGL
jgi:hypothetical protein